LLPVTTEKIIPSTRRFLNISKYKDSFFQGWKWLFSWE